MALWQMFGDKMRNQGRSLAEVESAEGTTVTLAAAPEGREGVVLLQVIMYGADDKEVGQHILDTFKADCERVREGGPVSSTVSASASASPAASALTSA